MTETTNTQSYIFFGRSGSGKGTQAKLLIEHLELTGKRVVYIETGKLFREIAKSDSFTGERVRAIIEAGGLMPYAFPIWIWTNAMVEQLQGDEILVLDGVARTRDEAQGLVTVLNFFGKTDVRIIDINVSRDDIMKRLLGRGRADDDHEKITRRLDWYESSVVPAIDVLVRDGGYEHIVINGEQTIDAVHQDIMKTIEI